MSHVGHRAFATLQIELYHWTIIASGIPIFIMIVFRKIINSTFKTSFDNFQNSIRAYGRPRVFATIQIELYRVADYHTKWSEIFYKDCMFENVFISLSRRILMIFKIVLRPIRPTTYQTALIHVENYHSKLSSTIYKHYMLENFFWRLLIRFQNYFCPLKKLPIYIPVCLKFSKLIVPRR